jgi:hypothetical protein
MHAGSGRSVEALRMREQSGALSDHGQWIDTRFERQSKTASPIRDGPDEARVEDGIADEDRPR